MIDVKEMRVGNWVSQKYVAFAQEGMAVVKDGSFWADAPFSIRDFQGYEKFPENCKPIPLTQEWLHRFGGKMSEETGVWRFSWGGNGEVFVFLHQGYDKYAFELGKGLCKPVEFVHQFQNFFFAFTEIELELRQ